MMFARQRFAVFVLCSLMLSCGPKVPNDQDLTSDIQARLYGNNLTHAANVKVAVANGVVTLSGDVPSSDVALQAMTLANGTAGIKSVNNQMKVAPTAGSDAASVPSDPTLAAQSASAAPSAPLAPLPPPPPVSVGDRGRTHEEMVRRDDEREQAAAPLKPRITTIHAGQPISIRMIDGIDTGHDQQGQTFRASLSAPITDDDRVVVPVGTPVTVLLAEARGAGRVKGRSELELRLTSIAYHGERVPIATSTYEAKGSARGKQTVIRTGIGAAAGALIGGLAGGGKGAGIGSLAGGGAGAGFQLLTHGQQIKIPSETEIEFRLAEPLVLRR